MGTCIDLSTLSKINGGPNLDLDLNVFHIEDLDLDLSFLKEVDLDLDLIIGGFGFEDSKSTNPPPPVIGAGIRIGMESMDFLLELESEPESDF